jgi:hypothetical protein
MQRPDMLEHPPQGDGSYIKFYSDAALGRLLGRDAVLEIDPVA